MTAQRASRLTRGEAAAAVEDAQEVPTFCARPACRQEYRGVLGNGRRQVFCSETCRRAAQREVRRLRARLRHFEGIVEQVRIDLGAYGHSEDDVELAGIDAQRYAERAVARAAGVLRFASNSEEPLAQEFRALYEAVEPLVSQR